MNESALLAAKADKQGSLLHLDNAVGLAESTTPEGQYAVAESSRKLAVVKESQKELIAADRLLRNAYTADRQLDPDSDPAFLVDFYKRTNRHSFADTFKRTFPVKDDGTGWGPWMAELQKRTKVQWHPSKYGNRAVITCNWLIMPDLTIRGLHIDKSSGNRELDGTCLTAIKSILMPPFISKRKYPVSISYEFEYQPPR